VVIIHTKRLNEQDQDKQWPGDGAAEQQQPRERPDLEVQGLGLHMSSS
jgi:hypothetical protein